MLFVGYRRWDDTDVNCQAILDGCEGVREMNNPVVKESLTTQPSNTPRTDAEEYMQNAQYEDKREAGWCSFSADFNFARNLERELAAAQADAKRYRWLRDDKRGRSLSVSSLEWTGNAKLSDAAVDAAMRIRWL